MGDVLLPDPVLLIIAAFSRHPDAITWAQDWLEKSFGPVALVSPSYAFEQTSYYEPTMGVGLRKQFLVLHDLVAPDCLPDVKVLTNALEQELICPGSYPEARPLNLDPGILTLGKFMLATTKDQAHRVYLRKGIYAEVTLRFQNRAFEPWPWTYADYRLPVVRDFLKEARTFYRKRLLEEKGPQAAMVPEGGDLS
jgi:hypothetical protein